MYNMFVHCCGFSDKNNVIFFVEEAKLFAVFTILSELCVILRPSGE